MNFDKNDNLTLEKDSSKDLIKDNKNMPDSRNKNSLLKNYHIKISSTVPTENTQSAITEENLTKANNSNQDLKLKNSNIIKKEEKGNKKLYFNLKIMKNLFYMIYYFILKIK